MNFIKNSLKIALTRGNPLIKVIIVALVILVIYNFVISDSYLFSSVKNIFASLVNPQTPASCGDPNVICIGTGYTPYTQGMSLNIAGTTYVLMENLVSTTSAGGLRITQPNIILDGNGYSLTCNGCTGHGVWVLGANGNTIKNLVLNWRPSDGSAILLYQSGSNTIQNNTVHGFVSVGSADLVNHSDNNIITDNIIDDGLGVLYGSSYNQIERNTLNKVSLEDIEYVSIRDGSNYNLFLNNHVSITGHSPTSSPSYVFGLYDAYNNTITNNTFEILGTYTTTGFYGWYFRDGAAFNLFENNTLVSADTALYSGIGRPAYGTPHDNTFRNNLIIGKGFGTLWMQDSPFNTLFDRNTIISQGGGHTVIIDATSTNSFINNTIYAATSSKAFYLYKDAPLTLRNNIFYSTNDVTFNINQNPTLINSNYNLFYRQNGGSIFLASGNYFTLQGYRNAYNKELNSTSGNPLFINIGQNNFNLQAGSPAIDTGDPSYSVPPGGGSRIDIGAHEYIQVQPPPSPTLSSPADSATNISVTPTLSWNVSAGATSYGLQVSTSSSFTSFAFNQNGIATTSQIISTPLENNKIYYWHVNATNAQGTSGYSSLWSFTTVASAAPSLSVSPSSNFAPTGNQGGPTFSPSSVDYTLSNIGTASMNWNVSSTQSWLTVSTENGTLAAGATTIVTISVNLNANSLTAGTYNATTTFTNTTNGVGNDTRSVTLTVQALPASMTVTPSDIFTSVGMQGGPFLPSSVNYIVRNTGGQNLTWAANESITWLDLSSYGETIVAGAFFPVTVSINASANALLPGVYTGTINFVNEANGAEDTSRGVQLTVQAPSVGMLNVIPGTGLISSGPVNTGPFVPQSQSYTLSNTGSAPLNWSAISSQTWVTISPSSGSLGVGANTTVSVSINNIANSLASGNYSDIVNFTNTTNHNGDDIRSITLTVSSGGQQTPSSNPMNFYVYIFDGTKWKFTTIFESEKISRLMGNDGGNDPGVFEVGTNMNLPDPSRGLVGYWKFDENTGTAVNDSSGWNNNGTINSLPGWISGQVVNALNFRGESFNDYVSVPIPNGIPNSKVTVSAWINLTADKTPGQFNRIINNNWDVGGGAWLLYTNNQGDLYFGVKGLSGIEYRDGNPGSRLQNNRWYHAVGVYDGTTVKVYLNGESGSGNSLIPNQTLYAGGSIDVGGITLTNRMYGKIDDVRIYNRALSDSEIKSLYNATR